jgi:hypothetical protein
VIMEILSLAGRLHSYLAQHNIVSPEIRVSHKHRRMLWDS